MSQSTGNHISEEALAALKAAPVPSAGNKVALAVLLTETTQTKVAADLGWLPSQLNAICGGRYRSVNLDTARKLADYFGCAIEDLFPVSAEQRRSA